MWLTDDKGFQNIGLHRTVPTHTTAKNVSQMVPVYDSLKEQHKAYNVLYSK